MNVGILAPGAAGPAAKDPDSGAFVFQIERDIHQLFGKPTSIDFQRASGLFGSISCTPGINSSPSAWPADLLCKNLNV